MAWSFEDDEKAHAEWRAKRDAAPRAVRGRRQAMIDGYHEARQSYEAQREDTAMGYKTETSEYNRDHGGGVTLASHMKSWRGAESDWGMYG